MSLPPVDPELNRELIAERSGWPDGVIDVCRRLEADYPAWILFWTNGGLAVTPHPGYRALLRAHLISAELYASTADEMRAQLAAVDPELAQPVWPAQLTPLVEPKD